MQPPLAFYYMGKSEMSASQRKVQDLLRQLRMEAGLRQLDLAERLGQPQSFVSKYETGERRLDFSEVAEICRSLGVTLASFISRLEGS